MINKQTDDNNQDAQDLIQTCDDYETTEETTNQAISDIIAYRSLKEGGLKTPSPYSTLYSVAGDSTEIKSKPLII